MGVKSGDNDRGMFSPALAALYCVSFLAGIAMGLFNPLISALLAQHQVSDLVVGINSTVFFLFVILAAPLVASLVPRYGARVVLAGGLTVTALSAVLFPWFDQLYEWFLARAIMGIGVGLYMISGQEALNRFANENRRAITSGIYALAFGIGMGIGPIIGAVLYDVAPMLAFGGGAMLLLFGLPGVLVYLPTAYNVPARPHAGLLRVLSLPLHGVFAYGVAEATLMSLYPLFLIHQGYTLSQAAIAFSIFVVGGIISTLPITYLADRFGHQRVLFGCALVGSIGTIALVCAQDIMLVGILSFLAGASLGPVFAVSLALLGTILPHDQLPSGSALFTALFSLGAMIAPASAALSMQYFGSQHIFSLSIVLFVTLVLRIAYQSSAWRVGAL